MDTQKALKQVLDLFKSDELPEAIKITRFPIFEVPSAKYSYLNRLLIHYSRADNEDCRGFRQWQAINRYVKKGAKATYILVPMISKKEKESDEELIVRYFKSVPVFRVQDTDGEPVDYQAVKLPDYPAILLKTAEDIGVSITAVSGDKKWGGAYSLTHKQIKLASPDEAVFAHELAHAVSHKIKGNGRGGQDPKEEITAELSAAVICNLLGLKANYGDNWKYIKGYSNGQSPITACLNVFDDVLNILNFIFGKETENVLTPN